MWTSPDTWPPWPPATPAGAAAIVRDELPFPGILGRVCPRYCEPVCRRGDVDEPIAICDLHRAAADHSKSTPRARPRPPANGWRSSAPGRRGLAAAWFLIGRGHQVTVYDSEEQPGGALRYLLPEFRLPASVLDAELQPLWEAGARFVGGSKMHYESDPQVLFDAGFDAVVVSTGAKAGGRQEGGARRTQPGRARVPAPAAHRPAQDPFGPGGRRR